MCVALGNVGRIGCEGWSTAIHGEPHLSWPGEVSPCHTLSMCVGRKGGKNDPLSSLKLALRKLSPELVRSRGPEG